MHAAGPERRNPRALIAAIVVALLALPTAVWAADRFTDVPGTNIHHDAINAIADAGVTGGCAPGRYCPRDAVRRDQMASFLDRFGALSGQEPVVNALTAQTAETAQTADDAAAVDGRTADELASRVVTASFPSATDIVGTVRNVGSVEIDAPVAGTLIAQAHGNFVTFGGRTVGLLGITTEPDVLEQGAGVATAGDLDSVDTIRRRFSVSPMAVLPVEAGTHTVHLNAVRSAVFNAQQFNLTETVLTVTFVPTG